MGGRKTEVRDIKVVKASLNKTFRKRNSSRIKRTETNITVGSLSKIFIAYVLVDKMKKVIAI